MSTMSTTHEQVEPGDFKAIEPTKITPASGRSRAWAMAFVLLLGCYDGKSSGLEDAGDDDAGQEEDEPPELVCDDIGSQPLRRVSSAQYEQILLDLLPAGLAEPALAASSFPRTVIDGGFSTFASANRVSTNVSMRIEDNAEAIAELFGSDVRTFAPQLVPCLPADYMPAEIDACMGDFVVDFGRRAFRRPLTDSEHEIVMALYEEVSSVDGAEVGLTAVLQYFLQAPALLYVVERHPEGEPYVALAPHELAVRLSLLFTNSMPDAELMAAVEEGRLRTRDDVEREARRLVAGPDVARAFAVFHHEWMHGFALDTAHREHPEWNEQSSVALREELGAFARWFLAETDGGFQTLMTTRAFPVDARLAEIYGRDVDEDAPPRAGILTTAAAMASLAHDRATSLVERGVFIRRHVMCLDPPPFPGEIDIETALEGYGDRPTARERLEPLMIEPSCSGCHVSINPLGYPFEVYDWAGVYRSTENGATIDTSAEIGLGSLQGEFADAAEMMDAIAGTAEARDCYARHWFRYALGRPEGPDDACTLDEIMEAFAASDGDVRELLVAIAVSDAFRFRKAGGSE
jgi:hypothetical protein